METIKNDIADLMFLFGWKPKVAYGKITQIQVEAENAWLDGKNADANPYPSGSANHWTWHHAWYQCNKNA